MAVSKLGTFFGHPVTHHNGLSKPIVGSLVIDHATLRMKIFDGKTWIDVSEEALEDLDKVESMYFNKRNITDEFLEEEYPELKQLKEEYEHMRDKLKVFEILKTDNA